MKLNIVLLIAAAFLTSLGLCNSVQADPIYGVPISLSAVFDDGTSLSGQFELDQYGYANTAPWSLTTSAGHSENATPIGAFTFTSSTGSVSSVAGVPDTYAIDFFNGSYSEELDLTFQHALDIGGPDPIVAGAAAYYPASPNSGQCAGYSCSASDERLITSGVALVPEPLTLSLFGAGLAGAGALRRRKKSKQV